MMNITTKYIKFKKIVLVTGLFLSSCTLLNAQQAPMYTQYMFNGMAINPAYMAMDEMLSIAALTRHQWVGFEGAPHSQTLTYHTPIKTTNSFYGAILTRDNIAEVLTETGGSLAFSQRVKVGDESWFAMGLNAGLSYATDHYNQTSTKSPSVGSDLTFKNQRATRGTVGWGLMIFNPKYYFGISSPKFIYSDLSDENHNNASTAYRPHFLMQAGAAYNLDGEEIKLKPNLLVKYVDGSPMQFDINTNLVFKNKFWVGTSYRYLDSFSFLTSIYLTSNIILSYSYDLPNFNNVNSARKGSHEFMLQFRLPVKGRDHLACYW